MTVIYSLKPEMRRRLKKPLGTLIRGSFAETTEKLKNIVWQEKPPCIISVGDTVSKNLEKDHIFPHLMIIDNIAMRRSTEPFAFSAEKTMHIKNPPGTITEEAIAAIQEAINAGERAKIVVDGEEDLLALIVILYVPENAFVVYGQPYEGIVVVKATQEKKAEIAGILATMGNTRKAK